jgi:uncharacterized protein YxjI
MRYTVKQKIFSFGDKFTIKNQYGEDVFQVAGKVFSIGQKLRIMNMQGQEIIYIEEKLFKFLPEYDIYMGGQLAAIVRKKFKFFSHSFEIQSDVGSYEIKGDIFAHDFSIYRNGNPVAWVRKEWISFSDAYDIEISDNIDHAFMLAMVIVIDQAIHDNKRK